VIDRHITQRTRSEKGRRWCKRIWTPLATCAQQGGLSVLARLGASSSGRCKLIWSAPSRPLRWRGLSVVARLGARSSGQYKLIWTVQAHLVGASSSGRYSTAVAVAVRPLTASHAPCLSVVLRAPPGDPVNGYLKCYPKSIPRREQFLSQASQPAPCPMFGINPSPSLKDYYPPSRANEQDRILI